VLTILLGRPTTVNGRGNSTEDGPRHRAYCARLRSKLTLLGLAGCGIVPTGVVEIAECVSIGSKGAASERVAALACVFGGAALCAWILTCSLLFTGSGHGLHSRGCHICWERQPRPRFAVRAGVGGSLVSFLVRLGLLCSYVVD